MMLYFKLFNKYPGKCLQKCLNNPADLCFFVTIRMPGCQLTE